MNELALFAGAGGGLLASTLLGWRTMCAVEINKFCRDVITARQRDGFLEPFPIWDDIKSFDGTPWRGKIDIVTGGFPCQDISIAGNGLGLDGERSGLWRAMSEVLSDVEPRYAFVENSPMLTRRGMGEILGDLAKMGFDARWGVYGADDIGAPHDRKRMWILGSHPNRMHAGRSKRTASGPDIRKPRWFSPKDREEQGKRLRKLGAVDDVQGGSTYSDRLRVVHGVANWMDRLKAIGNGQVPAVVRLSWDQLSKEFTDG